MGRIIPAAVNLASTAIFTRLAAPESYSTYVLAYATAQIGSALLFQWLRQGLLRFSSSAPRQDVIGTIGALYSGQALLTIALTAVAWAISDMQDPTILLLCGALTLGQAWFDLAQELQRADMQSKRYGILFLARSASGLILGTIALVMTDSGFWLTFGVLLSFIAPPFPFIWRHLGNGRLNTALLSEVVRYSWPLMISTSLATAAMVGDRLLVAALLSPEEAGQYGPAVDIARQSIFVFVQGIALAGYPMAIRALESGDRKGAEEQLRKNVELLLLVSAPATLGLIAVSDSVAALLLGSEYQESAKLLLPISAVASFFMCLRTFYFDQAMQLGKKTGAQVVVSAAIIIVFLGSAYLLIPMFGMMGAAAALLLSQASGLVISYSVGRSYFELPFPMGSALKILVASSGMFAVLTAVKSLLPGSGPAILVPLVLTGVTIYGLLIFLFDVLSVKEILLKKFTTWRNK